MTVSEYNFALLYFNGEGLEQTCNVTSKLSVNHIQFIVLGNTLGHLYLFTTNGTEYQ